MDFTIYAITNPKNKERLIEVIREEVEKIRNDGVTAEELAKAKAGYLQAARVRRTDDTSLAGQLIGSIMNDRTMKFVDEHEKRIQAATVESVNQAIRSYIDPDRLVMAAAGDFAGAGKDSETDTEDDSKEAVEAK